MEIEESRDDIKYPKPKICCIDLDKEASRCIQYAGFHVFEGTLGSKVKVHNKTQGDYKKIVLNYSFPINIHEYDIVVIDLTNEVEKIEYIDSEHEREANFNNQERYLISEFPAKLFNPVPYTTDILNRRLKENKKKFIIEVVFASEGVQISYQGIHITGYNKKKTEVGSYSNYSFNENIFLDNKRLGKEMHVCDNINLDLSNLLNANLKESIYEQTFHEPYASVIGKNFLPLIKNNIEELVSYFFISDKRATYVFPNFKNKAKFLKDFLSNILPSFHPDVFPYSTTFSWRDSEDYLLPNQKELFEKKEGIITKHENELREVDNEIQENSNKYKFLHDLITGTGEDLVRSLVDYFIWLDFKDVKAVDEESTNIREEDIRIELDNGILIIETKGIGGTSTDNDCSQIAKIRRRREKQQDKLDVNALYVVNHQRYLPPLQRSNPPFTQHQISDAENDDRGLLTTWQLFKLYFNIENKIISKEAARNQLLKYGLVGFTPDLVTKIGVPKELFKKGKVVIIDINNITLKIGDDIFIETNGDFERAKILSIQLEGNNVNEVSIGEVGLELNSLVNKKSSLWV